MPRKKEVTVYTFEELSDSAKETARAWWRGCLESDDYDNVIEDAATVADLLGINLRTRPVKLMNGSTRYDPCIWWSGFYSQGDGACFEGSYEYVKGAAKKVREYAPTDERLHLIAAQLQSIQAKNLYSITASCAQRGNYYHSGAMTVDASRADGRAMTSDAEDEVTQALRGFADWIYRQLDEENTYLNSDEYVDEAIKGNAYEFNEDGTIA